jgi:hypothetical protein
MPSQKRPPCLRSHPRLPRFRQAGIETLAQGRASALPTGRRDDQMGGSLFFFYPEKILCGMGSFKKTLRIRLLESLAAGQ